MFELYPNSYRQLHLAVPTCSDFADAIFRNILATPAPRRSYSCNRLLLLKLLLKDRVVAACLDSERRPLRAARPGCGA
jgi:hypothetical protein